MWNGSEDKKVQENGNAKVVVGGEDGRSNVLTMFNETVLKIIQGADVKCSAMKLLMAKPHI